MAKKLNTIRSYNTKVVETDKTISVKFYQTEIVSIDKTSKIATFRNNGFVTRTTVDRMKSACEQFKIPAVINIKGGSMYVNNIQLSGSVEVQWTSS